MNFSYILEILPSLIDRLPITIYIFFISAILSLILAVIVAGLRVAKLPVVNQIILVYSSFMRSTPGIIHIFIAYYGIPYLLRALNIPVASGNQALYATVALVAYNGAFMAEIIRPAYLSVGKDQQDAAKSIGMTNWQRLSRIIFPQVLPIALPSLTTALIDLLKDTSLLFLIGLVDLMGQADILIANSYGIYQVEVYVAIALIYWAMSSVIIWVNKKIENRFSMITG
ncbi:amino acid ABC transporter permease [Aerococcaceae bacterium 50-4]